MNKDKKTLRNFTIGVAGFLAIGVVASVTGFGNEAPSVAPVDPKIAVAQEYKIKALSNIDEIVALRHCDDLINEVNIAGNLMSDKGPAGYVNEAIYNYAYSNAVTLGCDMRDVLK